MGLVIEDEILQAARMTEEELRREIAILLFQREKLTLAQAARLAHLDRLQFQHLLASRRIPTHYGEEGLREDLETLSRIDPS